MKFGKFFRGEFMYVVGIVQGCGEFRIFRKILRKCGDWTKLWGIFEGCGELLDLVWVPREE